MTAKNTLQDWLNDFSKDDMQLSLNFDDNMLTTGYGAQPALTISAVGVDTISLGNITGSISGPTGAIGSSYNNITYGSGTGLYSVPSINTGSGAGGISGSAGGIGGYGQILTTGTSGITWSDFGNVSPGALQVKGDAEFDGDIKIKGKSLNQTLEKIEEKLAILHPNEELESKWDELRELRNRYIELEKEIIEKEKMWDILKR